MMVSVRTNKATNTSRTVLWIRRLSALAIVGFVAFNLHDKADDLKWVLGERTTPKATRRSDERAVMNNNTLPGIPKIVHQTYKSLDLPRNYDILRRECMKINPDWEFKLWTDEDNENLVKNGYPQLYELYQSYDVHIKRVDFARYVFLHQQGGVYMDLDIACLRPLDSVLDDIRGKFVAADQGTGYVANAFMAAPPRHETFERIFLEAPKRKDLHVVNATGPNFLNAVLQDEAAWKELPFEVIYGYNWKHPKHLMCHSRDACLKALPNGVTMTRWSHSWWWQGMDNSTWETFLTEE